MKYAYQNISDEEVKSITEAMRKRYGVDFTNYELKSLKRGLGRIITRNNFSSILDLWAAVLRDRVFFLECIDEITVNLTEMFRNEAVWEKLKTFLSIEFKATKKINVWHAGCSTGEEVYSVLYLIYKLNYFYKTTIFATDLNQKVLLKAQEGRYSSLLFKKYKRNFEKIFPNGSLKLIMEESNKGEGIVKKKFVDKVMFSHHNLVQDHYKTDLDIIFCRNVMIYFDVALKVKVIHKFYEALSSGGFLILGFYDSMPEESRQFFKPYNLDARIYQKI